MLSYVSVSFDCSQYQDVLHSLAVGLSLCWVTGQVLQPRQVSVRQDEPQITVLTIILPGLLL